MDEIEILEYIEYIKQRFKDLEHKGWDWSSFYNGALEGYAMFIKELEDE